MTVEDAELQYVPNNTVAIEDDETARKLTKIIDALEALDDVTNVATNAA